MILLSSTHRHNKIREVGFRVLGRDFRLILSPKKGLLHPNFKAVEIVDDDEPHVPAEEGGQKMKRESLVHVDHESFYDGRVYGEMKSRATVHVDSGSGVLTAKIETPDETYHIEPSWRHLDPTDDKSMIAYKVSLQKNPSLSLTHSSFTFWPFLFLYLYSLEVFRLLS